MNYSLVAPCLLFLSPSKTYHSLRIPESAGVLPSRRNAGYSLLLPEKEEKKMLKTLLSVIRAVIVELVDQLFRQFCAAVG